LSEPYRTVFAVSLGTWIGALVLAVLATALLFRRAGRAAAWPPCSTLLPLADLAGTWAGALAALALLLGRRGFGLPWAASLFLVALCVTASLYDRAVLLPSLDAAFKRMDAGDDPKWREEWRFLWAMARWGRAGTLVGGAGALVLGLAA